jgi:hypothetical protein
MIRVFSVGWYYETCKIEEEEKYQVESMLSFRHRWDGYLSKPPPPPPLQQSEQRSKPTPRLCSFGAVQQLERSNT